MAAGRQVVRGWILGPCEGLGIGLQALEVLWLRTLSSRRQLSPVLGNLPQGILQDFFLGHFFRSVDSKSELDFRLTSLKCADCIGRELESTDCIHQILGLLDLLFQSPEMLRATANLIGLVE